MKQHPILCLSVALVLAGCGGSAKKGPTLEKAETLFLLGDFRGALIELKNDDAPKARLLASLCLLKLDRAKRAREVLDELVAENPDPNLTARIQLALAEAHSRLGDPEASLRAAQGAERAAARRPGSIPRDELLFTVGSAYLRMGWKGAGKRRIEALIDRFPRSSLATEGVLRMQLAGYGIQVGDPLGPDDEAPYAGGLTCKVIRIELHGRTDFFALLDGLETFGQAHTLAGKLRREGLDVQVLP